MFAASRGAAMPWLPVLHTPDEDVAFFASEIESSYGWGATEDGRLLGFALLRDGWLNHLYVAPEWRGSGVGSALLSRVVAQSTGPVDLWAFARNEPALAFYATARLRGGGADRRSGERGEGARRPDAARPGRARPDRRRRGCGRAGVGAGPQLAGGLRRDRRRRAPRGSGRRRPFTGRWQDRLTGGQPGGRTRAATSGSAVVGFAQRRPAPRRGPRSATSRAGQRSTRCTSIRITGERASATALWRDVDAGWGADVAGVCLWVLRDNDRARHFYRACGLTPDGAERSILIGKRELTEVRMVIWR